MSVSHDISTIQNIPYAFYFAVFSVQFAQSFQTLSCLPYALFCSFLRTMVSDSLIRFTHKLHSAFRLDRKTCERFSVLQVQQLHTADILSQYLHKLCSENGTLVCRVTGMRSRTPGVVTFEHKKTESSLLPYID